VPALGITGGVATGKSTFAAALLRHLPGDLFDADQCSRDLLANDAGIREAVRKSFGPEAFDREGRPDRAWLRQLVFANSSKRLQLEQILHPAIRHQWAIRARDAARADRWFFVDIPLLFETHAEAHLTAVVVVGCPAATQRARLIGQRHLSADIADKIIASQLDLETKTKKADHLIWNDSTNSCLDRQADLLARWLRTRHC
jgi:dephospho-CoA kinase